jgi:hypothetical protein
MNLSEALELLEKKGEIFSDSALVTILSPDADLLAKFLGIRSNADVAQKIGKAFVNYNQGDRIQFGRSKNDVLPGGI